MLTNRLPKAKPYNTPPPFEQRDSWSSYGAVRVYSEVLYNLWGPRGSDSSDSWHEEILFSYKAFSWWTWDSNSRPTTHGLSTTPFVMALVRWATGERLTNRLRFITLSPASEHRDFWCSYGAVRAYSEVFDNLWGPRESDLSVRWATAKRLTSRLPKLSLITPPLKQAGVNKTIVETWNSAATGSIRRTALTGCGSLVCVGFAISLWRQLNYVW